MMATKSKPDASKPEIIGFDVVEDMKLNIMYTRLVTQVIIKIADVNARAIFILINTSPQNVEVESMKQGATKYNN